MESQDLDDVAERAERGRLFYETFAGAKAGDAWIEQRRKLESALGGRQPANAVHDENRPADRRGE